MPITHFSHTQLDTFLKCPEKYRFRYIEHIRTPVSGDLIRGDAYHKAIAFAYSGPIIYHEYPTLEAVVSVYSDVWDKRLSDRVVFDDDEDVSIPSVDFGDKDPGKMKDDGVILVTKYYNETMKRYIPEQVEARKTAIFNGISLISYIDLVTFDNIVIDHKVGKKSYSEDEIGRETQSSFYGLILGKDSLNFEIHQALAVKKPEIKIIPITRSRDDMDWVGKLITLSWQTIQAGLFCPSPEGWWCGKNYCEFYGYCRMPKTF